MAKLVAASRSLDFAWLESAVELVQSLISQLAQKVKKEIGDNHIKARRCW